MSSTFLHIWGLRYPLLDPHGSSEGCWERWLVQQLAQHRQCSLVCPIPFIHPGFPLFCIHIETLTFTYERIFYNCLSWSDLLQLIPCLQLLCILTLTTAFPFLKWLHISACVCVCVHIFSICSSVEGVFPRLILYLDCNELCCNKYGYATLGGRGMPLAVGFRDGLTKWQF